MKLWEKRIVSFVVAFAMLFTNCVNTYSVSVDSYEYGSLFVIGETTDKNELVSSAAEKLGAVESSYIFASLDDSLITKEVLTTFVEESKEEKVSDVKEEPKEDKALDEKKESEQDTSKADVEPEAKEDKASDEKKEPKQDTSKVDEESEAEEDNTSEVKEDSEKKEESKVDEEPETKVDNTSEVKEDSERKEEPKVDEELEAKEDKDLEVKEDSEEKEEPKVDEELETKEDKDLEVKEDSEKKEEPKAAESLEAKEDKDLEVKEDFKEKEEPKAAESLETKEDKDLEVKEDSEKKEEPKAAESLEAKEDKDLEVKEDSEKKEEPNVDKKPELKNEIVENDAKFEVDFSIDNVKGFYYDGIEWFDSDIEYIDEVLIESGLSGEILGYYELHSSGGAINVTDDLLLNGVIKAPKYENVLVYYMNPFGEYLYKTEYDEAKGGFLVEVPVEEFSNDYGYDLMTTELKPIVNSTESNFTGNEINEDNIKYFNATFFNYDARMYNFATRSKQLAGFLDVTPEMAAYYLANAGNTDRTQDYPDSPRANAEAADYARESTKNSLLFNFNAEESGHYSKAYDAWFEDSLNSIMRVDSGFNQPYLPQNTWTNQAITQGIVGDAGAALTSDGLPDFKYTEAGLFRAEDDENRTKVSLRATKESGSQEEWLLNYKPNLKFPFKKSGSYYVFDSDTMYIDNVLSKKSGEQIRLFEDDTAPIVNQKRGFWPFATSDNFVAYEDGIGGDSYLSDQYHFGMNLDAKFVVPKDFQVDGQDMTFEFSGDDDMWVYIDGKLALDVGGCHAAMTGSINFKTGEIVYNKVLDDLSMEDNWNNSGSGDKPFMPSDANGDYPALNANYTENVKWNLYGNVGLDKDNFAEGSLHDIEIFYLERGTGESNCKMTFNMSTVAEIEAEKTAYVYDNANSMRDVNTTDSFAYTGQDVYFDLGVKNNSKQILDNVVVYDKELKLLFDKNGIKENVEIDSKESPIYDKLNDFTTTSYDYTWKDSEISKNFTTFEIDAEIGISEKGVNVNGTTYGEAEDLAKLKEILKKKTAKDIRVDEYDKNSIYVIGRCDSVVFGKSYVSDDGKVEYKIKDTELYIRQVVEDGTSGNLLEDAQYAIVDTVSDSDTRSLYFPSNADYKQYMSYYNNVDYTVSVVVPSDYELIAIDVDDDEVAEDDLLDSSKYNENTEFVYTGQQYIKYITIYLRKTQNDDWHNGKVVVNEFKSIEVR